MPDIELSLEAQRSIDDFARSERDLAPSQLKIPEIIPGCVVVDIDPHGVGLGTLPRLIQVRINEFLQLVLWSGFPTLAVGDICTVVRRGTGNTYQVSGVSGATGILTDADVYRYHWVYDITLNTLIAYNTIVGATAYPALAAGDYILMKPGTFDESVPQVDGVIITEQIPGTVIIHSTSADVAVTCVDGGYLQCKEIRSTRGAGQNSHAIDISGLGAGESCDIFCEDAVATQTGATAAETCHAILGGGLGTLRIHANRIETYFTGSGGGTRNHAIYFDDDTLYVFSDVKVTFTGTAIGWTFGIYGESGGTGTCYLRGHAEAEGDNYCAALYSDGPEIKTWGDCDAISTFANSWVAGVEGDDGTIEVFGNCSGVGKGQAYGVFAIAAPADTTVVSVYGRCYGETTAAGATEAAGAKSDGTGTPTLRVHGDAIGVDIGGVSYGCHCDAGTLAHTCGRASGDTYDEYRSGGTLQVFMVEFASYSGTITSYYPGPDDFWIGIAGGAGARINFDTTPAPDVMNVANARFGVNEAAPDRRVHATEDDAVTGITYVKRTTHSLGGGGTSALFGVGEEHELEDGIGNNHVTSEAVTLWADPTNTIESPLRRWTTYPQGVAGPGYCGFWTWNDLGNTARTIIPNGTGDVTAILTVMYAISESGGGTAGGTATVANNSSIDLYDDGTDVFTLTVAADGSVTVTRSAGASTCDISLYMTWI